MNTTEDLRNEFDRLAGLAPDGDAVRAGLGAKVTRRRHHRTAVWAVAASVVVVAGGIAVGSAMMRSDPMPARPAAPAVVDVPEIPLPDGSALIRHQLEPVTSPVTVAPPAGLTGISWTNGPTRLSVAFFDPAQPADVTGAARYGVGDDGNPPSVGYAITDGPDDELTVIGAGGGQPATVTMRDIRVAEHAATLTTAQDGALDVLGFPATERISWQLADGRYIHVWAAGMPTRDSSPSSALADFAESIREEPMTLRRTIGIGLTLPGFTVDTSMNTEPVMSYMAGSLWLCRDGIDPLDPSTQAMVGSVDGPRESPMARGCIVAGVVNGGGSTAAQLDGNTEVQIDGRRIRVDTQYSTAIADLGHGLLGVVTTPTGFGVVADDPAESGLTIDDLATLAASVTLAPDVDVHPIDISGSDTGSSSAESQWSSGSSVAEPAVSGEAQSHPAPRGLEFVEGGKPEPGVALDYDVDPIARTVAVRLPLRNAGTDPITVTDIAVTGVGVTLQNVEIRLDNVPTDAEAAFQPVDLPAMMAPGAQVQFKITLHADECPLLPNYSDGEWPDLVVDYEYDGGLGQMGTMLPLDGWADALDAACQ